MLFNLTILEPLIFIILLSIIKFYYDYFTRSIPYPGPLPLPIVGNLHHYFYHRNDIPSWLFQLTLKYGNVFELYFGSNKYLMISDSRIVERVMSSAKDNNYFVRVTTRKGLDELQKGHSGMLFNVDFDSWSYIRKFFIRTAAAPSALKFTVKLVNNVFQDLEKYWNTLIEEQGQFLHDDKEKSVEIDFATWAKRFFSEATMLMIANRHPNVLSTYYNRITNKNPDNSIQKNSNEEFLDRLFIASDCMQYYVMVPPLIRNLPIIKSYTNYLYENMMWTRNYAINLAKERREEIESMDDKEKLSSDMLTMLLTVNTPRDTTQDIPNDNAKPMTLEEVGDNIVEILIEGADSPSNALSSILYCVGNNPDTEQRILDEIDKVFDHGSDFNITYEDLSKLEYIEAVIKEALRIWPVTATISRLAANSDQIDEYKIPRSAQLAINVMGLHMNPNYWKEPMKFNPSRFLEDEKETYDKNAFLYFGGGLRLCPGKQLAMTQLKVMVVLLYKKYKFEMITKEPLMLYNISNQCKELKIRIKHRK